MKPGFITVPFKVETDSGLSRAHGLAKFSAAGIVLEFENKFLGFLKGGVKEIRIPYSEILDVRVRYGFFNTRFERIFAPKIEIRLNNFATMSELPLKEGRFVLDVPRQDRDRAEAAIAALLDQNQAEDELPPVTGVRALFGDEAETKELE